MKDKKLAKALKRKKDLFVSRFVRDTSPTAWSSIDNWYFNHVCTVLSHAIKIAETPVDDLAKNKEIDLFKK